MTDYVGLIEGRLATTDATLGQVLSWLRDVRPGTPNLNGHGDYVDAWRHGGTAALLAYHHGYDNVKRWGDALEDYRPDNEWEFRQDIRNNEVGAKIGALARLTGMTVPELGDTIKAAFEAGAFQTDAYAPFPGSPTFRVGDKKLSVDSGVVTLPDGSRFDLTKSAVVSDGGYEYPLLRVIRKDGSVQDDWTNMEDGRTLFQSGIGKWEHPQSGDAPAASFNDRFAAMSPRASAAGGSLQRDGWLSPTLPGSLTAPSLTGLMFSPTPIANSFGALGRNSVPTGDFDNLRQSPGGLGDAPSPTMLAPRKDRRSGALNGQTPTSAQAAPPATPAFQRDAVYSPTGDFLGNFPIANALGPTASPTAFNGLGSNAGPWTAANAIARRIGGALDSAGRFVANGMVTPAEATLPSPPRWSAPTASSFPNLSPMPNQPSPAYFQGAPAYLQGGNAIPAMDANGSPLPGTDKNIRRLSRGTYSESPTSVFDTGASAVPFDPSDEPNFSGGLLGRLPTFISGIGPQNPARPAALPLDDEQQQADMRALDAKLSSSGDIKDAWALYSAMRSGWR